MWGLGPGSLTGGKPDATVASKTKAVNSARVLGKTLVELSIPHKTQKNMTLGWGDHRYIRYDGGQGSFFWSMFETTSYHSF